MSQFKGTAGRWSRNIAPATRYPTIFAGRNTHVAVVRSEGLTPEEVEANCNLITAAPDLFDAAHAAINCIVELPQNQANSEVLKMLNAAIAKATGEQA